MYNPVSTYRIQFHKGFNFDDFEKIIPYLEELGVGTIYASPVFSSVPGSMHGYDGIDPLQINPEIGTIEQLKEISKKLKSKNIGWIQDIVPNHMAYHSDNAWLMDVLEKGPASAYADFFDDSFTDEALFKGPIMLPFLGSDLQDAIENDELKIEPVNGKPVFKYAKQVWPLRKESYPDTTDYSEIDKEQLLQIANDQYYRLCSYKETDHRINFRRFFTVNSLICLNIQREEVFNTFHHLIIELVKDEVFQGLRIDHIDGLYDPSQYLERLRKAAGVECYIVVEKILEKGEQMPQWPIEGNTGYDFLALVNNLLTGTANKDKFGAFYKTLIHDDQSASMQITDKKAYILYNQMVGELENLTNLFLESGFVKKHKASKDELKEAISRFLINCPDYRFYGNSFPLAREEKKQVKEILKQVQNSDKKLKDAVGLLEKTFLHSNKNEKALHFYMRCMQFTGPLMAKGVEDTLMYTYNRFIGHNEVGDAPGAFSVSPADFHQAMSQRKKHWPLGMNASTTHDTKRGEDVRARLNILPDMAEEWFTAVVHWQELNRDIMQIGAPDANDEYFIYQTLLGAYPMPGEGENNFAERLQEYLQKTMREAKLHSNWAEPNEEYEQAVLEFAAKLLDKRRSFWADFQKIHEQLAERGIVNSLTQVLLKFTCPGTPDVYQGCEHWDLSLVDPDNRRPVDYEHRKDLLSKKPSLQSLWENKFNGQVKVWLVQLLSRERKLHPLLFAEGEYVPLEIKGKYAANLFAFARTYKRMWYVTIVPLNLPGISISDWEDTHVIMPSGAPEKYENLVHRSKGVQKLKIELKDIFETIPFAFLKLEHPDSGRGSGILMHISSLPSKFGTGDFGPGAREFAGTLHDTDQKYWQLLPLSPVNKNSQYSPYSSYSSMAGNTLLLSPEILAWEGGFDVSEFMSPGTARVDFEEVSATKQFVFDKAWLNFKANGSAAAFAGFNEFCTREKARLDDHALYVVLKNQHQNTAWHQWPDEYKKRNKKALADFGHNNEDAIAKEKWLQYQFSRQWNSLKKYCNQLDIKIFGDLPFYISYDSVDVWANPKIFSLDDAGDMTHVAGVPPDYFAAEGQLWGMPVFNWDKLKETGYDWWVQRIAKNLERFDLLRLDHFRAFSNYWSVPANEKTAVNGKWEKGPGADFFNVLKDKFGSLPFVAEDLGDIDDAVYALRDKFGLPGMRVLQFAFGGEHAEQSPHLPQNYVANNVAYTGTHDNNTTKGWFNNETGKIALSQLKDYTGTKPKEKNINELFTRLVMASAAKIVIIPMQDLLELDERSRMNIPASTDENWSWRYNPGKNDHHYQKLLKKFTQVYNRF